MFGGGGLGLGRRGAGLGLGLGGLGLLFRFGLGTVLTDDGGVGRGFLSSSSLWIIVGQILIFQISRLLTYGLMELK